MSDASDASSDEGTEEKTPEQKPDVPVNRKDLPKYMRVRYWHSWEEMLLIEFWRKHFGEVICLDKNLPIFRTISLGMKSYGFHINGQEVRRKIKTLKNKYIAERRRLGESEDKDAKSDWRLYPLMHCLMTPSPKAFEPLHEEKALNTILERIKTDPLYHMLSSGMPIVNSLEKIAAGEAVHLPAPKQFEDSFPVGNKTIAASIAYSYENKYKRSFTPRTPRPSEIAASRAKLIAAEAKGGSYVIETQTPHPISMGPGSLKPLHINKNSGPLKRLATEDSIKQIRLENIKLVEECVIAKKRLRMEEQQLKSYEKMVQQIQAQYENLFKNLKAA